MAFTHFSSAFCMPVNDEQKSKESNQTSYKVNFHSHGDHSHLKITKNDLGSSKKHNISDCISGKCGDSHNNKDFVNAIGKDDEGCPCCAAAIDLDEVAAATNEIKSGLGTHSPTGHVPDFSSGTHWGIFLGISGPLALSGLTAAYRNVEGTIDTRKKLNVVRKGLEKDIKSYKKQLKSATGGSVEKLEGVVDRLEAFRNNLQYSQFDTDFNLAVPGVINGVASALVMSTAVYSSPFALPAIALYAGCQTLRNGYDTFKHFNRMLPDDLKANVELSQKEGNQKINQITKSKRSFYSTNTIGFAVFTAGATLTAVAAIGATAGIALPVGVALLGAGAVVTGVTNNIWTNKFKPRNGDLGVDRKELDLERTSREIGERKLEKKILKNYAKEHLSKNPIKRFAGSLVSTLPFLQEKGANIRHAANLERIDKSGSSDKDRLDLVERLINIKKILKSESNNKENQDIKNKLVNFKKITKEEKAKYNLVTLDKKDGDFQNIFEACKELDIDELVIDKFIQSHILKATEKHNTSLKDANNITQKIKDSGLFKVIGSNIIPQTDKIQSDEKAKNSFMNAFEEVLLFDSVEKLRYEQYGLNDFYWSLDKVEKQKAKPANKKSINPFKGFFRKSSTKSTDSNSSSENDERSQAQVVDFNEPIKVESKTFFMDMSFCSPCMPHDSSNDLKTAVKNRLSYVEKVGKKAVDEQVPYDETYRNSNFSIQLEKIKKIRKQANKELDKIIANDELPYDEARFEVEQKYQPQAAKIFPDIFKKNTLKDGYSSLIQLQKERNFKGERLSI